MDEADEVIYTTDGKEFQRKYQKFGDICLTEKNERIFVCSACKTLYATPTQFWRHQRDEHGIRNYQNTPENVDDVAAESGEPKGSRESSDSTSLAAVGKRTRCSERLQNGVERKYAAAAAAEETQSKLNKIINQDNCDDSPLLKQALRNKTPMEANGSSSPATQFIPRATQEELHDALNASNFDDNFNEFILYCCPECGRQFQTDAQWKQHTAAAHNFFDPNKLNISLHKVNPDGSSVYKCDICRVLLKKPNIAPLRRHKLTHMPFKSYWCRLCGKKLRHKSGIVHHIRTVHRKGRDVIYKCTECQRSFYTEDQYNGHFKEQPTGGVYCPGPDFTINDDSLLTTDWGNMGNNTVNHNIDASNDMSMSEDCNYDNSFAFPNENATEEDYDRLNFIKTEKRELDSHSVEAVYMDVYNIDIKEEPPEIIDDTPDEDYGELWQGDAVLIAEEQLKLKAKASQQQHQLQVQQRKQHLQLQQRQQQLQQQQLQQKKPHSPIRTKAVIPLKDQQSNMDCAVCGRKFTIKKSLKKHLRTHGKKMDCRRCGVKISSIKALRRHLDLNRCKALNGKLAKSAKKSSSSNVRLKGSSVQNKPMERHNTLLEGDFRCEICPQYFSSEIQRSLHRGRKHGQTDCRLCGVKISAMSALRRHYSWNRCKALK